MKIVITGASGMVGHALAEHCRTLGDRVVAYNHQSLDIADAASVVKALHDEKPDVVINCAAWTDVDGCELDREHAYAANADGPENLATASRNVGAGFITISTDYVFDGTKEGFYTQDDQPNPQSVYGQSKLEGEHRAQNAYADTVVVRSGFIFGPGGTNFLSTIVDRAPRHEKLKVIRDCYGTPTYSIDLAPRLRDLAGMKTAGTFHVVNDGPGLSFEEFAVAALEIGGYSPSLLEPIEVDSLNRPAPRPRNSRLKCLRSAAIGLSPLPFWRSSLDNFISSQRSAQMVGKP